MDTLRSQFATRHICVGLLIGASIGAGGCAGNFQETRHGRAAGEWQVRLPETRSPIGALAFGRGGNSEPAEPVAPAVKEIFAARAPERRPRALQANAKLPTSAPPAAPIETSVPEQLPAQPTTQSASTELLQLAYAEPTARQRYAERETTAQKQQAFKGGDVIFIGIGTVLVVALIVVLILLLI